MKIRLGVDVDGVLADFNTAFIELVIKVTGRDLFPPRPFDIPTWNYPEYYGYTKEENARVWAEIESSKTFWELLPAYVDTGDAVDYLELGERITRNADVYYITSRPGLFSKAQTERWLRRAGVAHPTVLITSQKGTAALTLGLDAYIDDRWENALDVATLMKGKTKSVLLNRPWNVGYNAEAFGIQRTNTVIGFAAPVAADQSASAH